MVQDDANNGHNGCSFKALILLTEKQEPILQLNEFGTKQQLKSSARSSVNNVI